MGVVSSSPLVTNFKEWLIAIFNIHQQEQEIIALICWAIWMNRNETVGKVKLFTVFKVVTIAKNFLQQWRDDNRPLPQAIFENKGKSRLGLVIRDDLGSFVAANVVPVQGIVDPLIAETLGVREALSWIKSKFSRVQTIEMDALLVYSALQNDGVDNSYLGILIEECRLLAKELLNVKFN
ncbi:unnamed protein product [Fraxinus pennsylvanica]|uniref:RNase H type-1 domain-containing protein n=1 Tax=Fraxinus pennsylvanica TaxID=56036 RepID=A0AAD2E882_9LAMI|nr:unnamed protein product [Fraxinus pennsylvanica]